MYYSFWQYFSYRTLLYMTFSPCLDFFFFFDWFFSVSLGLRSCAWAFCSCKEGGATLHHCAGPSHCGSFSAEHRLEAHRLLKLWRRDFSCSVACGFFPDQVEPVSPHWQADSDLLYHRRSPAWIVLTSILCQDWFLLCLAATSERSSITSLRSCSVCLSPLLVSFIAVIKIWNYLPYFYVSSWAQGRWLPFHYSVVSSTMPGTHLVGTQ